MNRKLKKNLPGQWYKTELSRFGLNWEHCHKEEKDLVLDSRFIPRVEAAANCHKLTVASNVGIRGLRARDQELKQNVWPRRQGAEAKSKIYFSILHGT